MQTTQSRQNLRALVESSLLIAVAFVLSFFTILKLPQEGSVTPLSMLPILLIGLRHGLKWGLGGGFVYACLQMLQSLSSALQWLPDPTFGTVFSVILLDYIIAFTVLGFSGLFCGRKYGLLYAAPLCLTLRFLCHFLSGIIIWNMFAEDIPVWLYSLTYNGSFMAVELLLTMVVGFILCRTAPILFRKE